MWEGEGDVTMVTTKRKVKVTHCHHQMIKLSESIWFVWSKISHYGDKWRCHHGDEQTNNRKVKIGLVSK